MQRQKERHLPTKTILLTAIYHLPCNKSHGNTTESYIGCSETEFKSQYDNHMQSFKNIKKRNATEFPKHSGMPKNQVSIPQLTLNDPIYFMYIKFTFFLLK